MKPQDQKPTSKPRAYLSGQRLYCETCRFEIEILNPPTGFSAGQVLRCCGRDMTPEVGVCVHLESES
jgi:hypothetical protein